MKLPKTYERFVRTEEACNQQNEAILVDKDEHESSVATL